jgi:hypothetical protein
MKSQAFFVLAAVAVGCSAGPDGESAPAVAAEAATPRQVRAFDALTADTHVAWSWIQHPALGTPLHLAADRDRGAPVLADGKTAERATVDLLARYKDLFRMREPARELRASRTQQDELGMTHVRFQQVTHGVPVVGAELTAHYDRAGRVTSIQANYVPDLDRLDLEPSFSASALA